MWYCRHWVCEVQTRRGSGQTGRECGSQWPVCSPLWWAPHEPSPPLISLSPVVKATHRPLYCLISLWHLWDMHTRSPTHTHSPWSVDFSICFGLFIYVCNFVCVSVSRVVCSRYAWTCGHVQKLHRGIYFLRAPLPPSLDTRIIPWQPLINRPISVREQAGEDREDQTKTFYVEKDRSQGCMKTGKGVEGGEAIDPQSQSSGFHVSRCQVSAIGPVWKMSLRSTVMERHRFKSVCASSRRTERHWFTTTMTEEVKSALCAHLCL